MECRDGSFGTREKTMNDGKCRQPNVSESFQKITRENNQCSGERYSEDQVRQRLVFELRRCMLEWFDCNWPCWVCVYRLCLLRPSDVCGSVMALLGMSQSQAIQWSFRKVICSHKIYLLSFPLARGNRDVRILRQLYTCFFTKYKTNNLPWW